MLTSDQIAILDSPLLTEYPGSVAQRAALDLTKIGLEVNELTMRCMLHTLAFDPIPYLIEGVDPQLILLAGSYGWLKTKFDDFLEHYDRKPEILKMLLCGASDSRVQSAIQVGNSFELFTVLPTSLIREYMQSACGYTIYEYFTKKGKGNFSKGCGLTNSGDVSLLKTKEPHLQYLALTQMKQGISVKTLNDLTESIALTDLSKIQFLTTTRLEHHIIEYLVILKELDRPYFNFANSTRAYAHYLQLVKSSWTSYHKAVLIHQVIAMGLIAELRDISDDIYPWELFFAGY